ncbi:hypothetical protein [Microlunatus flavus]|uniref:Uncharacterized protein n=1 Tax=Microlunatus flavus TaxID=1036181 RepID=A0A1H9NB79_9ACTN|nr:hypothetical protein [Microlunatus flavus]SER33204.1 hypothetical protein SAMN05421756_11363 [Microlunatus flavus]
MPSDGGWDVPLAPVDRGGADAPEAKGAEPRRGARWAVVIAAVLVVGLLGVLLGARVDWGRIIGWGPAPSPGPTSASPETSPPDEPSPTESADPGEDEATALDGLLTQSAVTRIKVSRAVSHLQACSADEDDAATLSDGATERQELATQLEDLALDSLPEGDRLRQDLDDAWTTSAEADTEYRNAYDEVAGDCTSTTLQSSSSYSRADDLSGEATQAKKDFVKRWNSIAETYGLAHREHVEI